MKKFCYLLLLPWILAGLSCMVGLAQPTTAPELTYIRAGKLFDSEKGVFLTNQVIVVQGNVIKEVGGSVKVPARARVIDLSQSTVLPGLMDCHSHITSQSGNYYNDKFRRSPIDVAITAHVYAKRTLEAGFTTCRIVGSDEFIDVALKRAIENGDVVGPRLHVAGLAIGATGGHGDLNGFSPYLQFDGFSGVADGVEAIRQKVRFNFKYGADLIKMIATAGVLSEEESVGAPQYTLEEMTAMVDEAAMWGKKVAAHAHGMEGIKRAVRAGVASIEHGSLIDEEGIRLMKEKGTYLVPDIYTDEYIIAAADKLGLPEKIVEKERLLRKSQVENWRRAMNAGVKFAFGTDAGVFPHGDNAKQFHSLLQIGFTPAQVIQMATIHAADLIGVNNQLGSLAPGKLADIVAVSGNVEKDVRALEKMQFVMKNGTVYVHQGSPTAAASESKSPRKGEQ